jgi:hypothetical protein
MGYIGVGAGSDHEAFSYIIILFVFIVTNSTEQRLSSEA